MGLRRCAQNLWISLLITTLTVLATPGGIRTFLSLPIFLALSKPLFLKTFDEMSQSVRAAMQRHAACQDYVHKSSTLLHQNHRPDRRCHGLCAGLLAAKRPQARRFGVPLCKPLSHADLRPGRRTVQCHWHRDLLQASGGAMVLRAHFVHRSYHRPGMFGRRELRNAMPEIEDMAVPVPV